MARLSRILIAATRGAPMVDAASVEAVARRGLRGDRYFEGRGTFSGRPGVFAGARDVSIIDARAVDVCNERLGQRLDAADFRRNLVVEGLDLSALKHNDLVIGDVVLRILHGCPPCGYLSRLIGADAKAGLKGIGGMRAAIVRGGVLRAGAPIVTAPSDA